MSFLVTTLNLITKGAEANLYRGEWFGRNVIFKERVRKKYRVSDLDLQLRQQRTAAESKLLSTAKKCGVSTPTIYEIDMKKTTIVMEYIEGDRVKELLSNELNEDKKVICRKIGKSLGKLHKNGIIHGDPTTSNFIYAYGKVFFVDFGLGVFSDSLEDASVDLHLLKRALESTHFKIAEECFSEIRAGYAQIAGSERTKEIFDNVEKIRLRGRYTLRSDV